MQDQRRATILALIAVGLWSTVATAFKLSLRYLEPIQLLAYATLTSTLLMLFWVGVQRQLGELWPRFRHQPQLFLLLGLLNPFLYYLVLFAAYDILPAQQAQTISFTWAISLGLMSIAFLKRPYGARDGIGAILGYAGVLIIATRGDLLSLHFDSPTGVLLVLFSTLVWSTYWILHARMDADPVVGLCICFLCSLPFTLAECAYFSGFVPVNAAGLLGAAYVGLFEMGITFVIWLTALRTAHNIARISNLIFLSPFLSLLLIMLVLDEAIVPATVAGLALILTGTLIQQYRRGKA